MQNNQKKERILIATGIYPPDIGGPAQYAYELKKTWSEEGYKVTVKYFGKVEKLLPTGLRHLYFLVKTKLDFLRADKIFVLDTWSAALPIAILSFFTGKKFIIRTGGDFLWESHLERTKNKVLFKNFYNEELNSLNKKEKFVLNVTKWILKKADKIVFSTEWQRDIWVPTYSIPKEKTLIIENYYEYPIASNDPINKTFLASSRDLIFKNLDILKTVFEDSHIKNLGFDIDVEKSCHESFVLRIRNSYAVILVSLGDISPNLIMDAIKYGKPFIVTRENGIYERIKDIAIFVDPLNTSDIKEKVLWLCNEENYKNQKEKVANFSFRHSWKQIAEEFLSLELKV